MAPFSWARWLRSLIQPKVKSFRKPGRRMVLEYLEDRLAPATFTWTGGGGSDTRWSTPANWGGTAPTGSAATLDDLVFPGGVTSTTTNNDLPTVSGVAPTFNSITISGSGYTLNGNAINLGSPSVTGSGSLIVGQSATNETINLGVQLAGPAGGFQFFTINTGGSLTIAGVGLSGNSGSELTKGGAGTLKLSADDSNYTGPIFLNSGITVISNVHALGASASQPTTVATNAQLQVSNVTGTIPTELLLNGPGISNTGALLNAAGNNTWGGSVQLDTDSVIGVAAGSLTLSGVISDTGAGHNLTKVGTNQLILTNANTYRGATIIANGILTITNAQALGDSTAATNQTIVQNNIQGTGELQLQDLTGTGFTVNNEPLTLNGFGVNNGGALESVNGDMGWTGRVTLGSPNPNGSNVAIGVDFNPKTNPTVPTLTISGAIGDVAAPSGPFSLTKVGAGRLILPDANNYLGTTTVAAGALNIRDSQALGPATKTNGVTVNTGATLEMQLRGDGNPDSVTGTTNTLNVDYKINLSGSGINSGGALRSISGINTYSGAITLGASASIGVDSDPNPSSTFAYFTNDYSLTVTGNIGGAMTNTLGKTDDGQLILPKANSYNGPTNIMQGWVTIENAGSLGARDPGFGDAAQPAVTVASGAALDLYAPGGSINLTKNLILAGTGITHPDPLINQQGAVENLAGTNTLSGTIQLIGGVGIGVEKVDPSNPSSDLVTTNEISEAKGAAVTIANSASGGSTENSQIVTTGSSSGTITINYDMYSIPDELRIYYPPRGQPGSTRIFDSGLITGSGTINTAYGPGTSSSIEIVMDEGGGSPGTAWTYSATVTPTGAVGPGGIIKLGSQRLTLQGDGTYTGNVDIQNGVVRDENNTGLGSGVGTTIVETGTALEIAPATAANNGGSVAGLNVYGEHLVLNGTGNTTFSDTSPLMVLSNDNYWHGNVSLNNNVSVDVAVNSRLTIGGIIDDTSSTSTTGFSLSKVDSGELVLAAADTYRGGTNVNAGILTISNSQALGGTAVGTVVANGAQLQLQGGITVSGQPLTLQGSGVANASTTTPFQWFSAGPAPEQNAQVFNGATPGAENVSGRMTGIAVDPSNANVIYVSTSGGGGWKTQNGGLTWTPLFDTWGTNMVGGAIAVSPSDPRVIYLGTGEGNNSADSYYGTGVYESTNSGSTWTLLTGPSNSNPLFRTAVNKLVVDPQNPSIVYAAVSDEPVDGLAGNPGVWRFNGTSWLNLTDVTSTNRNTATGTTTPAPHTPGPDDDFRISFPQQNAAWTDLAIVVQSLVPLQYTLFASLGTASGSVVNAVYRTANPFAASANNPPVWLIGDGVTDGENTANWTTSANIGNTKIAASGGSIYAAISTPVGTLNEILLSVNGGVTWTATTAPYNYMSTQGWYDSTIVALNATTVIVGGADDGTGQYVLETVNSGAAWSNISTFAGQGPHTDEHALAVDANGNVLIGSDGGIWRFTTAAPAWTDINGNLATITFNGIATNPTNPNIAFGASQDNGGAMYSGSPAWQAVVGGDGGLIRVDPNNPNNVYEVENGFLNKSTTGGTAGSFNSVLNIGGTYFPFAIDQINSDRIVVGASFPFTIGGALRQSTDGGTTWTDISQQIPGQPFWSTTSLALATYQGAFQADPAFPAVTDQGANTYDPNTIYVSDGTHLFVTKDQGQSWSANRAPTLAMGTAIQDLQVDPTDRDIVYVVTTGFVGSTGTARVFKSTNAGQTWTDISAGLPDVPGWTLAIDPRTGNLYLGNDDGVWMLSGGGGLWQRFGTALPNVQVHDLNLNQTLNILTAGTYGRSMWQIYLDNPQSNSGALRAVSGANIWTGSVTLAGATTISANGTQNLQNGVATASLNIVGVISDQTPGANYKLTKTGQGDVIFSGTNTYGGLTEVAQGNLVVHNPQALGGSTNGTTVDSGAALELQSNLALEPIALNGDGVQPPFNGHNTGALRNNSGNNTYTGTLTLATNATIGVDSGSSLTIGFGTGIAGTGTVTDSSSNKQLTKEGTGLLVLNSADSYTGGTQVNQGALQIQNALALGSSGTTTVKDGAQLQIQTPSAGPLAGQPVVVAGQSLFLSGTGIFGTGALLDTAGSNSWTGAITLGSFPYLLLPNSTPATTPPTTIAIGVTSRADVLTLGGAIGQTGGTFGISKIGSGKVILSHANTYSGTTTVTTGWLDIQNNQALGGAIANTVQTVTVTGSAGTFALIFNGAGTPATGPNALPFNATALQVQNALNALSTIGGVGGSVTVTQPTAGTYIVTFGGNLAGFDQPTMTATVLGGDTVTVTTTTHGAGGVVVVNGAELQIDLDPTNSGTPQTVTGKPAMLNGSGISGAGAMDNISGTNTWAGNPIILATSSAIGVDAGSLTDTGDVTGVAASTLTKVGIGTLFFPAANDYRGLTQISNGDLDISNNQALGSSGTSEVQTVTVSGSAGNFTLSFDGATTAPALPFNATATQVQNALNALSTIGGVGGSVAVTQSGSVFTITFGASLTGFALPLVAATGTGGTTASSARTAAGAGGTVVNGGSLQVQGGLIFNAEPVVLNGNGYNNGGALENASGNNIWDRLLMLGSNASLGVDSAPNTLTLDQAIIDNNGGFGLTKFGPGTATFTGTLNNTYTGLTSVNNGTLALNKSGGALALDGNLTIGDGAIGSTNTATARLLASSQIITTGSVTTNFDGTFDLNNQTQTIKNLSMTGGSVTLTGAMSQLTLNGTVTATSDAAATISGAGTLFLAPPSPATATTFAVNAGTGPIDLVVSAPIGATSGDGLTKTGNGVLELTNNETYTGTTTISQGTLLADAPSGNTVGAVSLNGGTLGGLGQVGPVTATGSGGTVAPGDSAVSTGTLTTSGNVTLNSASTFYVVLNGADAAPGNPGNQHSVLAVNGNLNITGATLSGIVGPNVNIGDTFTIATFTGTLTGTFAVPAGEAANTVFINGLKFTVVYNANTIVLTRAKNNLTLSVTSSQNPSVYGQDVVFTATVTPEVGAAPPPTGPTGDTVTFQFDLGNGNGTFTQNAYLNSNGTATFDVLTATGSPMSVGSHNLVVTFNGDSVYSEADNSANPLVQVVKKSNTSVAVSASPSSPVYGQSVTITATVSPVAPGSGPPAPSGTVTFTVDGTQQMPAYTLDSSGRAQLVLNNLTAGVHRIGVVYSGDASFANSSTSSDFQLNVAKSSTTVSVSSSPNSTTYGQSVTFTANVVPVSPGTGIPTNTVSFYDGPVSSGVLLGTKTLVNGSASVTLSTLSAGTHSINVAYSGDSNFSSGTGSEAYTVSQAATTTGLTSSQNPSSFGQPIVFTATVSNSSATGVAPTGNVTFNIDNGAITQTVAINSSGTATYTISSLPMGVHAVFASYAGTSSFATSRSSTLLQRVSQSSTTTLTSSLNPSTYGQSVTYTATVSSTGSGTPTGSVNFIVNNGTPTPVALNSAHQAVLTLNNVPAGTNSVVASYTGDSNFGGSSATVSQTVNRATTSASVVGTPAPAAYGQTVTFTATINDTSPSSTGTATGTVTFVLDVGTPNVQTVGAFVGAGNQASINVSNLGVGSHNITATYNGDGNFTSSPQSSPFFMSVNQTTTSTTVNAAPEPSVYGQPTTLTATVSPTTSGGGTPTGSVTFNIDNGAITQSASLSGGTATITLSTLNVGAHSVVASYSGGSNFGSSTSATFTHNVTQATTTTTLGVSPSSTTVVGQQATFTATVNDSSSGSTATPTGTVTFNIDSGAAMPTAPVGPNGLATLNYTFATAGPHTVVATYAATTNFGGSNSPTLNQTVNAANTSTALTSSQNPSGSNQPVVFTATVSATAPGGGTPTGTVTFNIDSGAQTQNATLSGGVATITVSNLSMGPHSVVATYQGTANYLTSTSSTLTQNVIKSSATSLTAAPASGAVVGQQVSFTATVVAGMGQTGTPTGSVTFVIDGATQSPAVALSGSTATFNYTFTTAGSHTVVANYSGDSSFAGSSSSLNPVVSADSTSITVSSSANPAYFGQTIVFSATVAAQSPGSGAPTSGTVTFNIDSGAQVLTGNVSGGVATVNDAALAAGNHTVVATFNGNSSFAASGPSATFSQAVAPANTTMTITSSANPSMVGQSVTLIANVSTVAPGSGMPTGSVTFTVDGSPQSAAVDANGNAGIVLSGLSMGNHNISARFNNGNANFSPTTQTFTQMVNPVGTSVSVTSSPSAPVVGQAITLIATVTPAIKGQTPGSVTFTVDGVAQAPVAVNGNNQAGIILGSGLSTGNHTITVRYNNGTASYAPSSTTTTLTVSPASTTMSISSSANPASAGQPVTFIATVATVAPGSGIPPGSVTFYLDGVAQGTVAVNGNGQAGIILSNMAIGQRSITARYNNGNNNFAPTTASFTQTVNDVATQLAITLPTGVHAQTPFSLYVAAEDPQGTVVTTYAQPASVALVSAPAGGTLSGTTTTTFSGGYADFSSLVVNLGGTYTLRVTTADGLTNTITFTSLGRQT